MGKNRCSSQKAALTNALAATGISLFATTFTSAAHAEDNCDTVLITSTYQQVSHTSAAQSILQLINESNWQELKSEGQSKSSNSGNVFSFDLGTAGVNLDQFSSYSDFNAWRTSYFSQNSYNLSEDDARSYLSSFLPESVTNAWLSCKRLNSIGNGRGDLSLAIAKGSDPKQKVITITASWYPPPGGGPAALTTELNGKSYPLAPKSIPVNGIVSFSVTRRLNEQFSLIMNEVKGYSAEIFLPSDYAKQLPPEKPLSTRLQNAHWIDIDPRLPTPTRIGVVNSGEALLLDAVGSWYCNTLNNDGHTPPPMSALPACAQALPVSGFLHIDFQPTDGRPQQSFTYDGARLIVGPGIVDAYILDSVYPDNGWPSTDEPRAALY